MNYQQNPFWYKLIKLFKTTNTKYKISTGLTIPFLIGAHKILEEPFQNIEHLIKTIIDSEIDKYPIIQKCPDIRKYVIMVEDKGHCKKNFSNFPEIESEICKNKLLISTNAPNLGKTFERICFNLKVDYTDTINKEKYSWSKTKDDWRKFEDQEIELIKSIK